MMNRPATVDPVDLIAVRIARRRAQLRHAWQETREYVAQKNRYTPLAAVAAVAALGFGLSRLTHAPSAPGRRAAATRGGLLAAIAAMIGGGLRFAVSPTGRALWTSFKQARADNR